MFDNMDSNTEMSVMTPDPAEENTKIPDSAEENRKIPDPAK